jgi:putative effector of murein hydrolase
MNEILSMPLCGILVSIGAYLIGLRIRRLIPHPLANPLVIANVLIILVVLFTPLSSEQYLAGAGFISLFIVPATAALGLKIYRQWANFKANMIPILGGCIAGSVVSVASIWGLCRLFGIDRTITFSLFPKSVTTAIAIELSAKYGGLVGVTIPAVIISGVFSAFASPFFIKVLKLKDPVAAGVAMGTSGHAICTSAALELGETQGAMSGIAIGVAGLFTSIILGVFSVCYY